MDEAGICAAFTKKEIARLSAYPGIDPLTTNRLVRAPPPAKAFTNPEILLVGSTGIRTYSFFSLIYTISRQLR